MAEFKDMLKFFRSREGLSQNELAQKLGVSTSTISMYEVGRREPDFETEEKIADFFNTDLNTLRGRDVERLLDLSCDDSVLYDPLFDTLRQNYTHLNGEGREKLVDYSDDLVQSDKYKKRVQDGLLQNEA